METEPGSQAEVSSKEAVQAGQKGGDRRAGEEEETEDQQSPRRDVGRIQDGEPELLNTQEMLCCTDRSPFHPRAFWNCPSAISWKQN